ncbi:DUF4383 domain-containing protein [Candidatus Peribacteria bacterium]|nr:DUF4383 domain-containing protein [Candidatus Peribacteria bacterium]MBM3301242.1 DUF4383 domain-containing protein [Deltaproteobacteria bacterium]
MTSLVKIVTKILGIVLLLAGIAGFFVNGTLLVFEVDAVHNIVHIISGLIALVAAGTYSYARLFLIVFGIVYAVVAILGFMSGEVLGLFSVNMEDNYLHVAIAALCLVTGFGSRPSA